MTWFIASTYVLVVIALVLGAAWGRAVGRRSALVDAASLVEDEACRAALHGDDQAAGRLFGLARRVRDLEDPPAVAGGNRELAARKET